MEKTISKTAADAEGADEARPPAVKRAGEALFFAVLILISSLAIIAVAIAAPFVLAASAVAGVLTHKHGARGWRPVSA